MLKVTQNLKSLWGSIASLILLGLFIFFLIREKNELLNLQIIVKQAWTPLLVLGIVLTLVYLVLHSLLFQSSIATLGKSIPLKDTIRLYLKRLFISSFIPLGFSASQYAFSQELEKHHVSDLESHLASTIYLLTGAVSYLLFLVPTVLILLFTHQVTPIEWYGSLLLIASIILIFAEFFTLFRHQGVTYQLAKKVWPDLPEFIQSWQNKSLNRRSLLKGFGYSLLLELLGVIILYVTFWSLNVEGSFFLALVGYVLTILILTLSPIFQGIGLVEISLVYVLTQFGLPNAQALAVTLLYRFFQLWLPLALGFFMVARRRIKRWSNFFLAS